MKKALVLILTAVSVLALVILPGFASIESDMKSAVGSENSNAEFKLNIKAPESYKSGDAITVTVSVDSITHEGGLSSVEFEFVYDKDKLVLKNSVDAENALQCIKSQPDDSWENLTSADKENGTITCSVVTFGFEESSAKSNGDIKFSFDFEVKSGSTGDLGFYISHKTVLGSFNAERDIEDFVGNGGYAVTAEFIEVESSKEESSKAENSKTESSKTETSNENSKAESSTTEGSGTESSETSSESSLPVESEGSFPETSFEGNQSANTSSKPPMIWGGNGDKSKPVAQSAPVSSAESEADEKEGTLPDYAVPLMIIGAIVLAIIITVIVISVLEKRREHEALEAIKEELDQK